MDLEKRHRKLPNGKILEIKSRIPKSQFFERRYDLAFEYCIVRYESRFGGKESIFFMSKHETVLECKFFAAFFLPHKMAGIPLFD